MSGYDWLLFLHLLAAFLTVAAVVVYGGVLVLVRGSEAQAALVRPLAGVAGWLWSVGGLGALVFGVWLAVYLDAYSVFDGWVLAAIVLWLVVAAVGGRFTAAARRGVGAAGSGAPLGALYAVAAIATLLLLVDMIYKPGA